MPNMIETKNLVKVYGKEVKNEVLHGINLEIKKGEFSSIIGPSGSGKSTLLNLLGALDNPTEGEIYLNGSQINKLNDDQLADFRNKNIGFVFQFHHLLPEFTSVENVMMPNWIGDSNNSKKDENRAMELLDLVGLKGFENKLITKLSGGQKQRVAVARSLMNKPELILADEPTGNLDTETSTKIYNLLRDINKELDTTFIVVTHDRHIASKTDRVIEIIDGRIDKDYLNSPEHEYDNFENLAPKYCFLCGENVIK
jgi:lipoprotein-releasing system ATP-binding protein